MGAIKDQSPEDFLAGIRVKKPMKMATKRIQTSAARPPNHTAHDGRTSRNLSDFLYKGGGVNQKDLGTRLVCGRIEDKPDTSLS